MTDRLIVVGTSPARDALSALNEEDIFLWLGASAVSGPLTHQQLNRIISSDSQSACMQQEAWELARDLVCRLEQSVGLRGVDHSLLPLVRRALYAGPMLDIVLAIRAARVVAERLPSEASTVESWCATEVESAALGAVLADRYIGAGEQGGARAPRFTRRMLGLVRLGVLALLEGAVSLLRRWPAALMAVPRRSVHSRWINVYVAAAPHEAIVSGTISILRERGWRARRIDYSAEGLHGEPGATYDECVTLRSYRPGRFWLRLRQRTMRLSPALTAVVRQFCEEHGLAGMDAFVARHLASSLRITLPDALRAQRRLLRVYPCNASLTLNETDHAVEVLPLLSGRSLHPVVNVQHGIITENPLRSQFSFDAFCVFGEAVAEVLAGLGTPRERIRVVGDPRLDVIGRLPDAEYGQSTLRSRLGVGTDKVVLFAAQHANKFVSDLATYESLAMACAAISRMDGVRLVVKLHPVGKGRERGYDLALAEHDGAKITVTRSESLLELITLAECVVLYSSSVGFEAAALRKPVIVTDVFGAVDDTPFVEEGVALAVRDATELQGRIRDIMKGWRFTDEAYERANQRFHYRMDGRASERIADVVEELSGDRSRL